jgi:hypothetical protein
VVRVGTSKDSTISQHGCCTSGSLATGALQKERKKKITKGDVNERYRNSIKNVYELKYIQSNRTDMK